MARRERVPRHKSHDRNKNKNAKLSPFQREQKRTRLANQVPTAKTIGAYDSVPHSQRHVFNYLQEKMQRDKAKREALERERQEAQEAAEEEAAPVAGSSAEVDTTVSKKAKKAASTNSEAASADKKGATPTSTSSSSATGKKSKKPQMQFASLNAELSADMGAALQPLQPRGARNAAAAAAAADSDAPRTVEEIIARKKERKHKRKQEARRIRVAAELEDMEAQLEDYANNTSAKVKAAKRKARGEAASGNGGSSGPETSDERRERVNMAFDKELRSMEKEKAAMEKAQAAATTAAADSAASDATSRKRRRTTEQQREEDDDEGGHNGHHADGAGGGGAPRQRKHISFDPAVPDPSAAQAARRTSQAKKPSDFYDLVDVVRYGERVEAPPVFDVVPNHNAAVSRLASQLEREAATAGRSGKRGVDVTGSKERHRLLAGAGELGQQKRLARLGLAPAITHTVRPDGSADAAAARMSKEEEIKALRDRVMATYSRNRTKEVTVRKGVNMNHEFPKFA